MCDRLVHRGRSERLPACPEEVIGGRLGLAALREVMRERLRLALDHARVGPLEDARDTEMHLSPSGFELGVIRGLAKQRVPERVGRRALLVVDHFENPCTAELIDIVRDLPLGGGSDRRQEVERKRPPERRRDLGRDLCRAQLVESGHEQIVQRCRNGNREVRLELVAVAGVTQRW